MPVFGKQLEYRKTTVTFKAWETIPPFCPVLLSYMCFGVLQFVQCGKQLKKSKKELREKDWRNLEDGERLNKRGWLCQKSSIWMILFHNLCLLLLSLSPHRPSFSSLFLLPQIKLTVCCREGWSLLPVKKVHKKDGKRCFCSHSRECIFWTIRQTIASGLCVSCSLFPLATLLSKSSYQLNFGSRTRF